MLRSGLLALLLLAAPARASEEALETFDACWSLVPKHFYDKDLHGVDWEAVRERYRPQAARAEGDAEMRAVVERMLVELDASHAALLEGEVYRRLMAELNGRRTRTHGLLLEESEPGRFFVRAAYEGGPAVKAGLLLGDRIVTIDGKPVRESGALLDAGYDARFPGPRLYCLSAERAPRCVVAVEREAGAGPTLSFRLHAVEMSGVDAARRSARVEEVAGCAVGVVHLWYCQRGIAGALRDALAGPLKRCGALVVDLRGRGGYGHIVHRILDAVRRDGRPAAFLIDRRTRSAKEVLAHLVRLQGLGPLVGERTEGASLGAGFYPLPGGRHLELPIMDPKRWSGTRLEGVGVPPDVEAERKVPYAAGRDEILEAGLWAAVRERNRRRGWALVGGPSSDKQSMAERRGKPARSRTDRGPRRLEIDLIRFDSTRLPSGLFRHRPVKWVFEISRYPRSGAAGPS